MGLLVGLNTISMGLLKVPIAWLSSLFNHTVIEQQVKPCPVFRSTKRLMLWYLDQ